MAADVLTHWWQETGNCISIVSSNGFSPLCHQATIRTNFAMLLAWSMGTNLSDTWNIIQNTNFSVNRMHLKVSSVEMSAICAGSNVRHISKSQCKLPQVRKLAWHRLGVFSIMMTSLNGNISALLALCAGTSPIIGEFPAQRPVTQSLDVFFDLRLNKRLNKQSWGCWFEAPSGSLWRHCVWGVPGSTTDCPYGVWCRDPYRCHALCMLVHFFLKLQTTVGLYIWHNRNVLSLLLILLIFISKYLCVS